MFITYACDEKEHKRWFEKSLATNLQKAGIAVVLDQMMYSISISPSLSFEARGA